MLRVQSKRRRKQAAKSSNAYDFEAMKQENAKRVQWLASKGQTAEESTPTETKLASYDEVLSDSRRGSGADAGGRKRRSTSTASSRTMVDGVTEDPRER